MAQKISREDAITALARHEVSNSYDRAGILERLQSIFADDAPFLQYSFRWCQEAEDFVRDVEPRQIYKKIIAAGLIDEFKTGNFSDSSQSKFTEIFIEWEKDNFTFWDNKDLLAELNKIGIKTRLVEGDVIRLSCPCCGADTLPERHGWDICPVCWHEDSGFDNINSSYSYVGPNIGLHLYVQRINFLEYGIGCPDRKDLAKIAEPIEKYNRGRIFEIDVEKQIIFEKNTDWSAPLTPPSYSEYFDQILKLPAFQLADTVSKSYFWTSHEFDFSGFWDRFHKKISDDLYSPNLEEIESLKKNIGARSLLQEKFSHSLGIQF